MPHEVSQAAPASVRKKDFSKEGRVGCAKRYLGKSCPMREQSTVLRWEGAGESKLPLLSLDFAFHPCFLAHNRGIVHVY